jgi:hypothetical protein
VAGVTYAGSGGHPSPGRPRGLCSRSVPLRLVNGYIALFFVLGMWLLTRDLGRGLTGWSLGGNLVMRAAAEEPLLAAVVVDPVALNLLKPYRDG